MGIPIQKLLTVWADETSQKEIFSETFSEECYWRRRIELLWGLVWFCFILSFFFILRFFSSIFVLLFHQLWCIFLLCLFKCWEPKCESNNFLRMNRIFEQRVLCLHLWLCSLKKRMLNWSQRRITHFMVNYFYSHSLDRWAHINDWATLHPASISLKKKKKKKVDAEKDLYLVLYWSWPWLKPFSVSLNKQLLNWNRDLNFCLKYIHLEQIAYITFLLP